MRRRLAAGILLLTLGACDVPAERVPTPKAPAAVKVDVGEDSALKLDRGLNALWNAPKPGLLYAPPMR
jgi:hypothetical protein